MRIINIIDECSRKALWTQAFCSISAQNLIEVLNKVVEWRGKPEYIRCDNGPEFISKKLELWAFENNIELRFIQPGKPSQNGIIERLNGTLRKECLNLEWFESIPNSMNRSRIGGTFTIPSDPIVQSGTKPPMNLKT